MRNSWRKFLYYIGGEFLIVKDGEIWLLKEEVFVRILEIEGKI